MTENSNDFDQSSFSESRFQFSFPKHVAELKPEEQEDYLAIPGWRIWEHPGLSYMVREEYRQAFRKVEKNPLALLVSHHVDKEIFIAIATRYQEATGRHALPVRSSGVFDDGPPVLFLEPLTQEVIQRIDDLGEAPGPVGSVDKPNEILRSEHLRQALQLKQGRT